MLTSINKGIATQTLGHLSWVHPVRIKWNKK